MVDGLIYLKNIYLYIESPSHFLAGYLRVSRQLRHAPDPPWSMVVVRYKEVMFQWWLFFFCTDFKLVISGEFRGLTGYRGI